MWQLKTTSAPTRAQGDLAVRGIVCAEVDVGCGLAACSHLDHRRSHLALRCGLSNRRFLGLCDALC